MPEENKDDNDSSKKEDDQTKKDIDKEGDADKESGDTAGEKDNDSERDNDSSNHQIKQLRKESAKKRIEIKKLRDKLEDAEAKIAAASNKSEDGDKEASKTVKKEIDILREVNKRYIRAELKAEALKAGLVDVDALKMFDTSSIEIDVNGDVVGVKELIEEMRELKPYAFSTTVKDTTTDKKTPDSTKVNSKSALDMSSDEFAKTGEKLGLRVNSWS